jgi:hypothetical protein
MEINIDKDNNLNAAHDSGAANGYEFECCAGCHRVLDYYAEFLVSFG